MNQVPYPTTVVLLAIIGAVFGLGWQGTIDGAAVTSIFGGIVSGVLVGHYVKTTNTNGHVQLPGTKTTTKTESFTEPKAATKTESFTEPKAATKEDEL